VVWKNRQRLRGVGTRVNVLTIVMYHYVRDESRPHARTVAELDHQLDHVAHSYDVVRCADVAARGWPTNACVLTFDDALVEHARVVAPALERRGLTGVFAAPAQPVLERRLLDVQKTQFLLAATSDHAALGARIVELADLDDEEAFRARNTPPHRFDPPDTVFVKRALQDGLPAEQRQSVLDRLFREHVTEDERAFADELYLTLDDCRELVRRGHDVIGHGYAHQRLGLLDAESQRTEIERTREFVAAVGGTWALCYPYGSRDATTIRLLEERDCLLGLTTDARRATEADPLLELPRIDTNDLERERLQSSR
jgi:peptidoglycan/xylan/chitin deacetylase (PgdA/CDA1 family)